MNSPVQTEEAAARWLMRRDEPEWCERDQHELDAWLDESMDHKVAFWRLELGWKKADRLAALRVVPLLPVPRRWPLVRLLAMTLPLAACLVLCLWAAATSDFARQKTYVTEVGARESIVLRDGSTLELNTNTKLRALVDAHGREIWLDRGEAYFEVVHDASHPFVVHAGQRTITDLGTRFSVRRDNDDVDVAVTEGRVAITSADVPSGAPASLDKGDIAYLRGSSTKLKPASFDQLNAMLSWRQGQLLFDGTTLADAVAQFNRYNRKKLVIGSPAIAHIRIGGRFEPTNVVAFARLLRSAYGLNVVEKGDTVKID